MQNVNTRLGKVKLYAFPSVRLVRSKKDDPITI